jgi:hypothetical protein
MAAIRHDCNATGICYILEFNPRIEVFDHCYPGNISMSNDDTYPAEWCVSSVDVNYFFEKMEWKTPFAKLDWAQETHLKRHSMIPGFLSICVWGDPKTMQVEKYRLFWLGVDYGEKRGTYEDVCTIKKEWVRFCMSGRRAEYNLVSRSIPELPWTRVSEAPAAIKAKKQFEYISGKTPASWRTMQ